MSKKILVVDDDEGILEGFQALLESVGYRVLISTSTISIQSILKKETPDLILLDVLLSGEDGRKICKDLKSHKETKDIPIIMTSAHPSAEKSALEAGADAYIAKPFEMDYLLATITQFTNNQ